MAMHVGVASMRMYRGERVPVWVEEGPPGSTVEIEVLGTHPNERQRLAIPLNEAGKGWQPLVLPHWEWIELACEGRQVFRLPLVARPTLSKRTVWGLERAARVLDFVTGDVGRHHGLGWGARAKLLRRITKAHRAGISLSTPRQHLLLAEEVLAIPPSIPGDVVECGCAHGAATVALSLACAASNRRLFVCDSFAGLPPPKEGEELDRRLGGALFQWVEGDYASEGGLEGVKKRVREHGNLDVCRFVKGYFADTLPHLETDSIVLVFEDADLISSVLDCLRWLWPKLQPGCKFFSHEPWSYDIVSLFYDEAWWRKELGLVAPGFSGSGDGNLKAPDLGFAVKLDPARDVRQQHALRRAESASSA
jgi:hypothetical protein